MYDMQNIEKLPRLGVEAGPAWTAFVQFDRAAFTDGAISAKNKQLIAVAVALATQCPYCIELHAKAARETGASEAELAEAAFVSAAIKASGALTHATHFVRHEASA